MPSPLSLKEMSLPGDTLGLFQSASYLLPVQVISYSSLEVWFSTYSVCQSSNVKLTCNVLVGSTVYSPVAVSYSFAVAV